MAAEPPRIPGQDLWTVDTNEDTIIEFLADVEGNWEYFLRFVSKSKTMFWEGETRGVWGPGKLCLRPNCILVFGGDAPDKGPGDIRFIKSMVNLKREYPEQVFVVLGNRDLIKIRMPAELEESEVENPDYFIPPWDKKNAKRWEDWIKEKNLDRSRVSRLKWMFQFTMGCQDTTFDTRREELALIGEEECDDISVLNSHLNSVDPKNEDPWMLDFLRVGKIAVVLGDTLYVHGGCQEEHIGRVPGSDVVHNDVRSWAAALNKWKDEELDAYEKNGRTWQTNGDGTRWRGGEKLMEYGTPGAGKQTVIYFNPFVNGNPVRKPKAVLDFLNDSKIKRVLSGHQPHGQCPTVVRSPKEDHGLLFVTADTSRSDGSACKLFNPADNRGHVVCVVWNQGRYTFMDGVTKDGAAIHFKVSTDPDEDELPMALVGRQLIGDYWVKAVRKEDGQVLAALGKGFNIIVEHLHHKQACMKLKTEYSLPKFDEMNLASAIVEFMRGLVPYPVILEDAHDADASEEAIKKDNLHKTLAFNKEEFLNADTYLIALNALFSPHIVNGEGIKKVVKNVNRLVELGKRVIIVTNDSTYTRREVFDYVTKLGIPLMTSFEKAKKQGRIAEAAMSSDISLRRGVSAPAGEKRKLDAEAHSVVTSGNVCTWLLHKRGVKHPFVMCSESGILEEFKLLGIDGYYATVDETGKRKPEFNKPVTRENIEHLIEQGPRDIDAVVIGWDQTFSALSVAVAAQYIRWNSHKKDFPFITCSMDDSGHLGLTGDDFMPEFKNMRVRAVGNGAIANCVSAAVGDIPPIDCGKPSTAMKEFLRRPDGMDLDLTRSVLIGGTMETDVMIANTTGMKSLLVLSGVDTVEDVMKQSDPRQFPDWLVHSFGEIDL